jgi:UDP-4-amino-4,6-dideoxy-N-acetyl-beta-L-altrosamine N-acetyltransferase
MRDYGQSTYGISKMKSMGLLRAIAEEEVGLMLAWRNTPSVRANMYTQHEIGEEEHRRWWGDVSKSKNQSYFMYEFHGMPRGVVSFSLIDAFNQNAFWAFYAAPDSEKGTGARMEYLALGYAFRELSLHKLQCEVLAFNSAVIKMHMKFGFKSEGVFREQQKIGDSFVSVHRLGLLRSEWLEAQPKMEAKISALNREIT